MAVGDCLDIDSKLQSVCTTAHPVSVAMRTSRRESTLAGAWQLPARRILFFTYRFNFRWFHDCVLTLARRRSIEDVQVDVVATRTDADSDTAARGDLYALDEWAKWQRRL